MDETATDSSMGKAYDPKATEQRIYEFWLEGGYFTPEIDRSRKPFVIMMPPPNVTGQLHMGHALTTALEDLMTRWHRMLGDPTLFLPGTDHAGIATQVVVERMLAADNLTRQDLGREAFTKTVWEWVDRYGSRIYEQLKRLGASCDWTRQGFTLDEGPSKAVRTTFVNLYKKGLIYRGERIVNWCPRCVTALSDLEVKHREEDANLYHIRYRIEGGDGELIIATTRPETLLADTAVAINPDDDRYAAFAGKNAILPLLGRVIPVVTDEAVDPEFGTGALKVTPGHDPADFEIGERHSLPIINILNPDGTMNENATHYEGVDRLEVRTKIVEELDKEGLLVKIEPYRHSVGHCDRCAQIVEPIVSKQWYMSMEGLAKPAIEAVESGRIRVVPERFTKVYYNWMYNIKDWCISRQLWWGHRIPAWYCQDCNAVVVDLDDPTSCDQCGSPKLERDPDVLDTWFSSALWPHSTLGWPNQTEDLDYFYPGSVLETGHDILFFWVARMIMTGIENAGDIPFETIYLHGMVLDPTGIKMSKVKGNVLDPLDLADIYGADALRFALTTGNSPGNDMRLNESKMEASRNFANKIWNASRFVMANIERSEGSVNLSCPPTPEHLEDRWIVARLQTTVSNVDRYMKEFQFGEAQREVHDFLWGEYCDWYLEMSKIRMRAGDDSPLPILAYVLEQTLRLLHPFMPFITEEIWGTLIKMLPAEYDAPSALIVASYPVADTSLADPQAESDIGAVIEMVRAIRNLRAEFRIEANRNVEAIVDAPDIEKVIESESAAIVALAQVDPLIMASGSSSDGAGDGDSVSLVLSRGTVTVPLEGVVDVDREKARLTEELQQIDSGAQRLSARLSKADFLSKAPPEVVEKERARLSALEDRRIRVAETISRLGG
jgi:valyl-tRNA synthetase